MRQTKWEKQIIEAGGEIITWDHEVIMDFLLAIFYQEQDALLLRASTDDRSFRVLDYTLGWDDYFKNPTNFGGSAHYCKKLRKFVTIQYSDRYNFLVEFSIASKATFFARDWYMQLKHVFPFGCSIKNGTHYLMQT